MSGWGTRASEGAARWIRVEDVLAPVMLPATVAESLEPATAGGEGNRAGDGPLAVEKRSGVLTNNGLDDVDFPVFLGVVMAVEAATGM